MPAASVCRNGSCDVFNIDLLGQEQQKLTLKHETNVESQGRLRRAPCKVVWCRPSMPTVLHNGLARSLLGAPPPPLM